MIHSEAATHFASTDVGAYNSRCINDKVKLSFAVTVILQQEIPRYVNAKKKKGKEQKEKNRKRKQDMSRMEAK